MSPLWIFGVAPILAALALTGWARARLLLVTVTGGSMAPALVDGDRVLVRRCRVDAVVQGRIVVIHRPDPVFGWEGPGGLGYWIKRAVAVPGDRVSQDAASPVLIGRAVVPLDSLIIVGDHPGSEDSRRWGVMPGRQLVGVVIARLGRGRSPADPRLVDGGMDGTSADRRVLAHRGDVPAGRHG